MRTLMKSALIGTLAAAGVVLVISGVLRFCLYRHAHPGLAASTETPEALFTHYEDVAFTSSDGVALSGWLIPGKEGAPVVILCHDLGESKSSMLGLAARLAEQKYSILMFDFRGHGTSAGSSSFGTLEKRDLLGAIDWASVRRGVDGSRIGIVGVGMGAYAGILAAAERPRVRCLALDSPYAEASSQYAAAKMPAGVMRGLTTRWSRLVYDLTYRVRSGQENAAGRIHDLRDRDLLFLAPKTVDPVSQTVRSLYDAVPEDRNAFKNLELLPATRTTSLYGADRDLYDHELIGFFRSYLPVASRLAALSPQPARARARK